jgi:dihydrofolate reductase
VRGSVCIHMKVTVQTFLTLDGVMQAPGGPDEDPSNAFTHGGWQAPFADPAVGEFVAELNGHASAFLLGRTTFDIFRGYWPDQTDPANPIATAINSLPKYVVSNSLSEAEATWRGDHPDTARLVTGDVVAAVRALKAEPGDELQIWGSGRLLQTLLPVWEPSAPEPSTTTELSASCVTPSASHAAGSDPTASRSCIGCAT